MYQHKWFAFFLLPLFLMFLFASIPADLSLQPSRDSCSFVSPSKEDMEGAIWNKTYGGPLWDQCFDMIEVSTGGFAMTGFTGSPWASGGGILWLVRTDSQGNQLWNRTYTTNVSWGHSLLECDDGGFIVAGKLVNDQPRVWVLRTDANGNHLWNHTYGGTQPAVGWVVSELIECDEGGYAIFGTGPDSNPLNNSDYYLVRIDTDGNLLWNYTYDHGWMDSPALKGVVQCSDGGFVIVGYTRDVQWQSPYSDIWLVRTDADGRPLWNMTYGGAEAEFPNDILKVDSDYIIVYQVAVTGGETRVIRVDDEGNVAINRKTGSANCFSMIQCSNGGFAMVGSITEEEDLYGYFVRTDDEINPFWEQTYNRSRRDEISTIIECSDGGFAMAGITEVDWEAGDFDFWLLRVADPGPPPPPVELPIGWIAVGVGVPVALIAIVALWRTKRR